MKKALLQNIPQNKEFAVFHETRRAAAQTIPGRRFISVHNVVAWNKLADSCKDRLRKGSAVLIDGELQSRTFKTDEQKNRTVVEIKAKRIQFLNKFNKTQSNGDDVVSESDDETDFEDNSFDKFLTDEESDLMKD